jgi:hypothetical protein
VLGKVRMHGASGCVSPAPQSVTEFQQVERLSPPNSLVFGPLTDPFRPQISNNLSCSLLPLLCFYSVFLPNDLVSDFISSCSLLNTVKISSPLLVICLYISCYTEQSMAVLYQTRPFELPKGFGGRLITVIITYIFIYLRYI